MKRTRLVRVVRDIYGSFFALNFVTMVKEDAVTVL